MAASRDPSCPDASRRYDLRGQELLNGIDYVEVASDLRTLSLYFIARAPDWLTPAHVSISGGRRIRGIRALEVEVCRAEAEDRDDCVRVRLDRSGDFSCYRVSIVDLDDRGRPTDRRHPAFDPRYWYVDFEFETDCETGQDCLADPCPAEAIEQPDLNYLAKDYASFRQLVLDRLALLVPDWRERHVPDLGVALVELLAYVGDHLSYYQDAVATEAYLDTARLRVSVRRHARLVDYVMHEGCNARAWLHLALEGADHLPLDLGGVGFTTQPAVRPGGAAAPAAASTPADEPSADHAWFEATTERAELRRAHNDIRFYTWGGELCCLPRGSTSATLVDGEPAEEADEPCAGAERVLALAVGDVLVFEEVRGPLTGAPEDADPAHRHAVRLTKVEAGCDPLYRQPVLEIEWSAEDALPFPLCLTSQSEDCEPVHDVSLAHGNVILVDHGRARPPEYLGEVPSEELVTCGPCGQERVRVAGSFAPRLKSGPLTHRAPPPTTGPASRALSQDPRHAKPLLAPLVSGPADLPTAASDDAKAAQLLTSHDTAWAPVTDLLASGPGDAHVVVEVDDDGIARLRFGDGRLGRRPSAGHGFAAGYRVGNGTRGNVGAEAIRHIVPAVGTDGVTVTPRNPLPAVGGTDPEAVAQVKRLAPHAFRQVLRRAVTADDYARLAERDFDAEVQRAAGDLRWTGSWYELRLAVDAFGGSEPEAGLLERIEAGLERYRRIGHDLRVVPAENVPLELELEVCVAPHYRRDQVAAAVRRRLGNRQLPDGTLGLFHPDNLSFGEGVAVSRIVAAARGVPGVDDVDVKRLQRFGEPEEDVPADGILPLGAFEVARLDSDPGHPDNGLLTVTARGGV